MGPEEERQSFLRDAWMAHTDEEGVTVADAKGAEADEAIRLYASMKRMIQESPYLNDDRREQLVDILRAVEVSCLRYAMSINDLALSRHQKKTKDEIQTSDQNRRLAHNRLIDEINLLSRQFKEAGLDNLWRNGVGSSREEIGAWGQKVADHLRNSRGGKDRDYGSHQSEEREEVVR